MLRNAWLMLLSVANKKSCSEKYSKGEKRTDKMVVDLNCHVHEIFSLLRVIAEVIMWVRCGQK